MSAPSPASGRYAQALFELAREDGLLDAVRADLTALADAVDTSETFRRFLADPVLQSRQRVFLLRRLLRERVRPLTQRFMLFLESKGRLQSFRETARAFMKLYDEERGIRRVRIVSAAPLTPVQTARIKQRLQEAYAAEIEADVHVDPSLIGGFRIHAGDHVHDASMATQLAMARRKLSHG